VAAFNRLVERYQRLAYNVAYRTLEQPEDAADATQDAFVAAFRAIRELRGESFKAWLLRIVVNTCYDRLRRRQRHSAASLEQLSAGAAQAPPDPRPGPDSVALGSETVRVVQRALAKLPPDQRVVVVLCDVQGFSYEETAATLAIAVGTVKSRLSRARERLREELAAEGELPSASRRPLDEGLAMP